MTKAKPRKAKGEPCEATTSAGTPCKLAGAGAGGRCWLHGGKSLTGINHPNYKHGRYVTSNPSMAQAMQQARADPDFLDLGEEIHITTAIIQDLFSRLESTESGAAWKAAQAAIDRYDKAKAAMQYAQQYQALDDLRAVIREGLQIQTLRDDMAGWIDLRRKLVESYTRYLSGGQASILADQFLLVLAIIARAVKEYVSTPTERQKIIDVIQNVA